MDRLLNKKEIEYILKQAGNPVYKIPGAIGFVGNRNPLSILKITLKGLIFIQGNNETGFKHITERHNYFSERIDWIEFRDQKGNITEKKDKFGKVEKRLDNPSRFSLKSIPIIDYSMIADDVFSKENVNTVKNKEKDQFDLYIGYSEQLDRKRTRYILITYKDTKIVHTLFPDDRKSKKKKIINLSRGQLSATENPNFYPVILIELSYTNQHKITRYLVIIRRDLKSGLEQFYIQQNTFSGHPNQTMYIGERPTKPDINISNYLMSLEFADFSPLEKIIKQMEESFSNKKKLLVLTTIKNGTLFEGEAT